MMKNDIIKRNINCVANLRRNYGKFICILCKQERKIWVFIWKNDEKLVRAERERKIMIYQERKKKKDFPWNKFILSDVFTKLWCPVTDNVFKLLISREISVWLTKEKLFGKFSTFTFHLWTFSSISSQPPPKCKRRGRNSIIKRMFALDTERNFSW